MTDIATALQEVRERIAQAAVACGRNPEDIALLAVSKTKPADMIRQAHAAGQQAFGENYLQDALPKIAELQELGLEWHYIGRIQSNKTKEIAQYFAWVHGIDKLKHAQRLSAQRPTDLPPLQCCIQVNLSGETSKGGVSTADLPQLAEDIAALPNLKLRGLMTMPDPGSSREAQARVFARLAELRTQLNTRGHALDTLSMGMSGDLELAIAAGSTLVRVGTDIFGARNY
jgi:pyridoxal phosphate enzyme (YggS family)